MGRGSPFLGMPLHGGPDGGCGCALHHCNDTGHIAMTYTALAVLVLLGDDLGGVSVDGIKAHLATLQAEDGAFFSSAERVEKDMRFVYCATAVSHFIGDWSTIDKNKMTEYILASQAWD